MPKVLFLMGPTASGKTDLALAIAERIPVHLISVDSALIYRGMDIGTAKPDPKTLAQHPHALIDIRDPSERYSAAEFAQDARIEIEKAHRDRCLPVLVGGTLLYFKALREGLAQLPCANAELRDEIEQRAEKYGWPAVHAELTERDPRAGARIKPMDAQRIQRALEVVLLTGRSIESFWDEQQRVKFPWDLCTVSLYPGDRKGLHRRIEHRFDLMLEQGFEQEVSRLKQRADLYPELPAIRSVGYRQMWAYLEGQLSWDEMRHKAIVATRQLAKRQLTWIRSWDERLNVDPFENPDTAIDKTLRQIMEPSI